MTGVATGPEPPDSNSTRPLRISTYKILLHHLSSPYLQDSVAEPGTGLYSSVLERAWIPVLVSIVSGSTWSSMCFFAQCEGRFLEGGENRQHCGRLVCTSTYALNCVKRFCLAQQSLLLVISPNDSHQLYAASVHGLRATAVTKKYEGISLISDSGILVWMLWATGWGHGVLACVAPRYWMLWISRGACSWRTIRGKLVNMPQTSNTELRTMYVRYRLSPPVGGTTSWA